VSQLRGALSGSPVQHRPSAVPRPARRVAAAVAATQRLKPQPGKGTQRLGRPKPSAKKTGTQRLGGGTTPVEKQAKKVSAVQGFSSSIATRVDALSTDELDLQHKLRKLGCRLCKGLSSGVSAHVGGADGSPDQLTRPESCSACCHTA